jgi:hypothetical protein
MPSLRLLFLALAINAPLYAQGVSFVGTLEPSIKSDSFKTIDDIKKTLNGTEQVNLGVLLFNLDLGMMGAVGSHDHTFDSWVLTPEIMQDRHLRPTMGGHELIITGFDDEAVAVDNQGRTHKGLFTVRNAWNDKGNFYMSYDYFNVLEMEAQRIRRMPADGGMSSVRA